MTDGDRRAEQVAQAGDPEHAHRPVRLPAEPEVERRCRVVPAREGQVPAAQVARLQQVHDAAPVVAQHLEVLVAFAVPQVLTGEGRRPVVRFRCVGVAQPAGRRREQVVRVAHGAQPVPVAGAAIGGLHEPPVRAEAGLQLPEQIERQQAGAHREHGARHPVGAVVGADTDLGASHDKLRLGRGGKLHAVVRGIGQHVEIEIVEIDRQVCAQRYRSLAFGIRVVRVDRGEVQHVGRAEEVAHAPGDRVLAAAEEQDVAKREVGEQLRDLDDVVEAAGRLRVLIGGERIAEVDLAEHAKVVRRPRVQEDAGAQIDGNALRIRLQRCVGQILKRRPCRLSGQGESVRAADLHGRARQHGGTPGLVLCDQHLAGKQVGGVERALRLPEQRPLVGADRLGARGACGEDQHQQSRRRQPVPRHGHRLARSTYALVNTESGIAASDRSLMLMRVFLPSTSSSTKIISVATTPPPTRA